jgi:hypothetical protein
MKRKISSTYQRLYKNWLDSAIHRFYKSIDTVEIARQLSGKPTVEFLTLLAVEFELRERAIIAGMLFKLFRDDKAWVKFVCTLAKLCYKQETRQAKASKRKNVDLAVFKANNLNSLNKRKKRADGFKRSL